MPYLMTQSLLSSWQWLYKARDAFPFDEDKADAAEAKAEADFLRVLRRERGEQSPAMLAGIEFEALCYRVADGEDVSRLSDGQLTYPSGYSGARKVAEIIRGGQYQVRLSRKISVSGYDFLLFGVLDALKAGAIYDIKHKSRSLGSFDLAGSYTDSPQHPAYLRLVPEAEEFHYLVSDGTDLYVETYRREDTPPIEGIISDFIQYLDSAGLKDLYYQNWQARQHR